MTPTAPEGFTFWGTVRREAAAATISALFNRHGCDNVWTKIDSTSRKTTIYVKETK